MSNELIYCKGLHGDVSFTVQFLDKLIERNKSTINCAIECDFPETPLCDISESNYRSIVMCWLGGCYPVIDHGSRTIKILGDTISYDYGYDSDAEFNCEIDGVECSIDSIPVAYDWSK